MRQTVLIILALATAPVQVRAQVARAPADSVLRRRTTEVASKFEEFAGRRGALYTRTIERIGEIRAEEYRTLIVSVVTVTDAGASGGSVSAIAFGTRFAAHEFPTSVGIVDADKGESFAAALALMEKRAPWLRDAVNTTEAVCTARTGLRVSVVGKGKDQRLFIESPRYGIDPFEFEIQDVARLRAIIDQSAEKVKATR